MTAPDVRHYRFGPSDRTGWLLGLGDVQCIAIGCGILASGICLNLRLPVAVVFGPLLCAAALRVRALERPAHTRARSRRARMGRHPHDRQDGVVRTTPTPSRGPTDCMCPPSSSRRSWRGSRSPRHARRTGPDADAPPAARSSTTAATARLSATLRVRGREFALCERDTQERQLHLWGDALAAFCTERGPVARLRWTEWAAPSGLDESARLSRRAHPTRRQVAGGRDVPRRCSPKLARCRPNMTCSSPSPSTNVGSGPSAGLTSDRDIVAEKTLMDEVQLLSSRLESAGLIVDLPLCPAELAEVAAARVSTRSARTGGANRAAKLGAARRIRRACRTPGPLAVRAAWDHVRVDRAVHAAYVVAEWPRFEVPPNWMEPLLLHPGGVRTVAVHYEPVAPSRSRRQVDRRDRETRIRRGATNTVRFPDRCPPPPSTIGGPRTGGRTRRRLRRVRIRRIRDRHRRRPRRRWIVRAPTMNRPPPRPASNCVASTDVMTSRSRVGCRSDVASRRDVSCERRTVAPLRALRVPRHRATTAHLCSAYPFLAEAGLGPRGVYLGTNVLSGGGGFALRPVRGVRGRNRHEPQHVVRR